MSSSLTTFAAFLKTRYEDSARVQNLTEADNVALGLFAKDEGFSGSSLDIPILYSNPQGVGGTSLATIAAVNDNLRGAKFSLTVGEYGGYVEINEKVMRASRDNPGAFLTNRAAEIDGLYTQIADSINTYLHGNGGYALCKVASVSGETFTVTDVAALHAIENGMHVVAATTDGTSGALKTGSTYVTGVNRETGVVTVEDLSDIDDPTGIAAADYIFRKGDFGNTTNNLIVKGIDAFCPSSSSSISTLFGMTRSTDPIRLGGCRLASTEYAGLGIEDRLQLLGAVMTGRYKAKAPDTILLHPEDWQKLAVALQARGTRPANDDSARSGYAYLEMVVGGSRCKVYADRARTKGLAAVLRLGTWRLWSMGKLIGPANQDGTDILRTAASGTSTVSTNYEYRAISYPGLVCNAPGWNGVVPV